MKKNSRKWIALTTGYLLFLASALLFFELPPLLDEIRSDIQLNDFQVGWLQGIYALPAVLFALIGGLYVDRVDSRVSGTIAGILLLVGNLITNFMPFFWSMLVGRFLVGVGTIIINLVAARMITLWFPRNQRGRAMSVFHTSWPITAGIAFSTFVDFGAAIGWRGVLLVANGFVLFALVLFILKAPKDPASEHVNDQKNSVKDVFKLPKELWISAIAWFCFTSCMISILTFGAGFLSSAGYSYGRGSFIVGLLMWTAIPGSIIAGWILDRWGILKWYLFFSSIVSGLCLIAFSQNLEPFSFMILSGAAAAFVPIVIYAMPGLLVSNQQLGIAFGIILTFSNLGNTLGPVLVGLINTVTNETATGMIVAALMMVITGIIGLFLKKHRLAEGT